MTRGLLRFRVIRFPWHVATDLQVRNAWFVRLRRPANLFQPSPYTAPDRYPEIFTFVRQQLGAAPRLLSFGCSTGEEVASLLRYFPGGSVRGLDVNRLSLRRARRIRDPRVSFAVAGSTAAEPDGHYDAIFAMAVFRHGALTDGASATCRPHLAFADFERTVTDLVRSLSPSGLLVIQHSHFRFADCEIAKSFETVLTLPGLAAPVYGPDDQLLDIPSYDDVVFRRREPPR